MKIYNTLTRRKEDFVPITPGEVRMYVCGPTVYDYIHIGNARPAVVFDTVRRYLEYRGYKVHYVSNYTDVDDRIIMKAVSEKTDASVISERYIAECEKDISALGVMPATIHPKATEEIEGMIEMIAGLIAKGHAYAAADGTVYFSVRSFPGYGRLSGKNLDELQGSRSLQVTGEEQKEDPLDFVLWKPKKEGEPYWASPWCDGRPGWHIECSVMSRKYLGDEIDIHTGGEDLIFPHHENELAQSESIRGCDMARYWVHNGFVRINSEKMSKSLNNFTTIRDLLKLYPPEAVRLFLLTKHYRSPIDFNMEAMEETEKNLKKIYETMSRLRKELSINKWTKIHLTDDTAKEYEQLAADWLKAMNDDLNTAAALGHIFALVRLANRLCEDKSLRRGEGAGVLYSNILEQLAEFGQSTGLFSQEPAIALANLRTCRAKRRGIDEKLVNELLEKRAIARKNKDFACSDALREELAAMSVEVQDAAEGQIWDVL